MIKTYEYRGRETFNKKIILNVEIEANKAKSIGRTNELINEVLHMTEVLL